MKGDYFLKIGIKIMLWAYFLVHITQKWIHKAILLLFLMIGFFIITVDNVIYFWVDSI